jgi:hypothetical protein
MQVEQVHIMLAVAAAVVQVEQEPTLLQEQVVLESHHQ